MRLVFSELFSMNYKSQSQRIRVLSETWMKNEMYCPACGNDTFQKFPITQGLLIFCAMNAVKYMNLKAKEARPVKLYSTEHILQHLKE